jgi:hypothetical protein
MFVFRFRREIGSKRWFLRRWREVGEDLFEEFGEVEDEG